MPTLGSGRGTGGGTSNIPVLQYATGASAAPAPVAAPVAAGPAPGFAGFSSGGATGFSSGSSSGSSSSRSDSTSFAVPEMMNVYNQLLGLNRDNYSRVLDVYSSGLNHLRDVFPDVYQGYGRLQDQVMDTLGVGGGGWGVAQPGANAIGEAFARAQGNTTQQMINAGLGNTTVRGSLQNQNALQAGRAYGELGAQLADRAAGYQAQIGSQAQAARMQHLAMQQQLYGQLGGQLAGYNFANTAGNILGTRASSSGSSSQSSSNVSQDQRAGQYGPDAYGTRGQLAGPGNYRGATMMPERGGYGGGGGAYGGHVPFAAELAPLRPPYMGYGELGDPLSFGAPGLAGLPGASAGGQDAQVALGLSGLLGGWDNAVDPYFTNVG